MFELRKLLILLLLFCCPKLFFAPAFADPREQLAERLYKKIEQYQAAGHSPALGGATGMWRNKQRDNDHEYEIAHIALGDVVMTFGIRDDGSRFDLGMGEGGLKQYRGYWAYACRDCCKGHTYWGPGVLNVDRRNSASSIHIQGKEVDPDTCELSDRDTTVQYEMELIDMLQWKEHIPGKLIHIVAAPAVGSQSAQYKASVKIKWNAAFKGVHSISLVQRGAGRYILEQSTQLTGEYEILSARSGKIEILFVAYSQDGSILHMESQSLDIPPIPGLGG